MILSGISHSEYLAHAIKKHGDRFDYSEMNYTGPNNKIKIKCVSCNVIYEVYPHPHLSHGCRNKKCRYTGRTLDIFIKESSKIHNNRYSYPSQEFNRLKHITIICPDHGNFNQLPGNHLSGQGCKKCIIDLQKGTTEEFVKRAKEIHGGLYDYTKSIYSGSKIPLIISCYKHGEFKQAPSDHILGKSVCRTCALEKRFGHIFSKGEVYREYHPYYKRVKYLTMIEYQDYKEIINPENKTRGVLQYHIDHMYSVKNGFLNNVNPEIVSSRVNLTMLNYSENSKKSMNNSHTLEELLEKYKGIKND